MVKKSKDSVFVKLVYWGPAGSGKTTCIDTLYMITKEQEKEVAPQGDLTKISMASGSTLYFDRGIFQHKTQKAIFYHIYTVAGQRRFSPLRKQIYGGTDGVIFVWDSQKVRFEDNLESLRELKKLSEGRLIKQVPFLVMANKQDLENTMTKDEIIEVLRSEGLYYDVKNPLNLWNPQVYETVALKENYRNVYSVFSELARRTALYQVYGSGSAPVTEKKVKLSDKVPDF